MKKEVGGENLKISKRQGVKEQKQEDWDIVQKWYSILVAKGKKGYTKVLTNKTVKKKQNLSECFLLCRAGS